MSDAKFEKVTASDRTLYGPRKLVLCGFGPEAKSKFNAVAEMAGLAATPMVWAGKEHLNLRMADLVELPDGSAGTPIPEMPRAIIVAGIQEKQLHALMTVSRKSGMKLPLWAALTPTSETWTLVQLLAELMTEREAMEKKA